ncbi:MAG: bifunctional oligoribonuclease/PAP phosphatase NrnA [Acholeplasmatales bacterium]|jgi:phosphoesterase RecJ-like protein|nr:bifunctional oligoribonuclease/PAP phosphatase NrnA [Acholeplasmatales bacterium]
MDIKDKILEKITEYNDIVIQTHAFPDPDATGSSYGLYLSLKQAFPAKNIYIIGTPTSFSMDAVFNTIDIEIIKKSLFIITDVAVDHLLDDHRYKDASYVIAIDHHENPADLLKIDLHLKESTFTSAAGLITYLLSNLKIKIPSNAASFLYLGIVGDTSRFMYINKDSGYMTFLCAQLLFNSGFEPKKVYDTLYLENLENRIIKTKFSNFELTTKNVAYRFNTYQMVSDALSTPQYISRGLVNQMAGIKEVLIWANFTQNEKGNILCELRSRGIKVLDVAVKHGGGGHNEACGATLKDFDEAAQVLKELDNLL